MSFSSLSTVLVHSQCSLSVDFNENVYKSTVHYQQTVHRRSLRLSGENSGKFSYKRSTYFPQKLGKIRTKIERILDLHS